MGTCEMVALALWQLRWQLRYPQLARALFPFRHLRCTHVYEAAAHYLKGLNKGKDSSCARRDLGWMLGDISLLKGLSSTRTGCPGQCWSLQVFKRQLKNIFVVLRDEFNGSAGVTVGLDGLRELFQPKLFHYSVLCYHKGQPRN